MWNNPQVDPWWYGILICDAVSFTLFFVRSRRGRLLYATLPIAGILWLAYEAAIAQHLSVTVPIRLDIPFVLGAIAFPVLPILIHCRRVKKQNACEKEPSNQEMVRSG